MPQTVRILLMAVAATSMSIFVAAAAHADTTPENVVRAKSIKREIHTIVLPQLTVAKAGYKGREFKKSTLFQIDTNLTDDSDVLLRLQAKQKKILYIEFRF